MSKKQVMEYDNSGVRRQDRLLPEENAYRLLKEGEYGVLSMVTPEGTPYGVPVNYVWDGKDALYIHCAPEGRKLRCLRETPETSFCIVGRTHVIPNKFTTNYESIVLTCRAGLGLPEAERMDALHRIIDKYAPEFREIGEKYAEKSFHRTEIIKLTIVSFSGKSKNIPL